MPLSETQLSQVHDFREWLESVAADREHFGAKERFDREDASTLAIRWAMGESVWYEVTVRPFIPQVRVGVMTDDRWKSEELEQMIEDSGDTMSEFVELGFETAGLDWTEPPVEHYRDQSKCFYFATPVDLESLDDMADEGLRRKVLQMLDGYYHAFSGSDGV